LARRAKAVADSLTALAAEPKVLDAVAEAIVGALAPAIEDFEAAKRAPPSRLLSTRDNEHASPAGRTLNLTSGSCIVHNRISGSDFRFGSRSGTALDLDQQPLCRAGFISGKVGSRTFTSKPPTHAYFDPSRPALDIEAARNDGSDVSEEMSLCVPSFSWA
jgi:hypothetical protein